MSPAQEVCVDASVAVKVVVMEPDSDKADALFEAWANEGEQLIAPAFFEVETDSILRQKVTLRKELTPGASQSRLCKAANFADPAHFYARTETAGVGGGCRLWFCDGVRCHLSRAGRATWVRVLDGRRALVPAGERHAYLCQMAPEL
jgi:hypothetical protein